MEASIWVLFQATSLLKKTEGVVTLTVCNPNQKKVAQEEEEKAKQSESNNGNNGTAPDVGGEIKTGNTILCLS